MQCYPKLYNHQILSLSTINLLDVMLSVASHNIGLSMTNQVFIHNNNAINVKGNKQYLLKQKIKKKHKKLSLS